MTIKKFGEVNDMKKKSKIPIVIVICLGLLISVGNVFFCLDYTNRLDILTADNAQNPISVLFDWQSNMLQQVIRNAKSQLKSFAMSSDVIDLLKNPNDTEQIKKSQEYTERYYNNLDGWEGLYIEDWNTKVLTHSIPETIGAVIRKNDTIEQFRGSMTDSDDGFYFSGCVESPASGQYVMSFCYMVTDENDEPIGLVGGAPFLESLSTRFSRMDMTTANVIDYSIINADNCLYAYHSDTSRIGEEVMDAQLLKIIDKVAGGSTEDSYTNNGKILSYRTLPGTNYILILNCNEAKFDNTDKSMNTRIILYCAAFELLLILAVIAAIAALRRFGKKALAAAQTAAVTAETAVQEVQTAAETAVTETNGAETDENGPKDE